MLPVTLYGSVRSSYVQTALWMCEEKGVAYCNEPLAIGSDAHLALNPYGKIPVMKHQGVCLYETLAICVYLNEQFPGPDLFPPELIQQARMMQWVSAFNTEIYPKLTRNWLFPALGIRDQDPKAFAKAPQEARALLMPMEQVLGEGAYLAGDSLTLADLFLLPLLRYCQGLPGGPEMMAELPALAQWFAVNSRRAGAEAVWQRIEDENP
ncbi:glutathione S-transferase family protein [Ferrimonas balearica]|uniref:glutathione S-transferase family protein n=1 Tax=Ferrimonas balearica TaxID=44012 RepID=UPI001C9907A4|nr:glutathione S-transferase family protein [Ferrimonas balearica]MBY5992080.1 glutathione S-transferase family protein [Ferrimonas balearica]